MTGGMEDAAVIGGLMAVQFVYAGNSVLLSYLMSLGLNPLTVVICFASATSLFLSPLALYFERSKWPKKLSFKLLLQLVLLSFGGVTLFQTLLLEGIKLTSPAMATAMPNLAPGLIFIIAWCCRLERVKLSCVYSKVKILGTLLCVVGALTMSIMQSTITIPAKEQIITSPPTIVFFNKEKIVGCLYLMLAVFILSSDVVLKATVLSELPAPMSLSAITSFIGVFTTAAVLLLQNHNLQTDWSILNIKDLLSYSLLGGTVSGISLSFNGWAMKKRGPVLVSIFSPIGTVISVILSVFSLGDTISIGSLAGMFLMFCGLYFVLWAKGKEDYCDGSGYQSDDFDLEKPLLS
ncbi:WAT1-related protein At5g47470-like [Benincasa hispida]|uniref:WAT1-related protein At5g47470-like n=1 Tax=Benincasa hispida TaxID=102211 RepID=UPI0018FF445B|nr:WAT1-related protein At5g47470-like [Benincasa hispida]